MTNMLTTVFADHPIHGQVVTDGGEQQATRPLLPPSDETPTSLLSIAGQALTQAHSETIKAMVEDTEADVIIASQPQSEIVKPALNRELSIDILEAETGMQPDIATLGDDCVVIALPMGAEPIEPSQINRLCGNATEKATDPPIRCVITSSVALSVDPYDRSTTLSGLETYRDRLPEQWWTAQTLHLSTALRAGFSTTLRDSDSSEVRFIGIGESKADLGVGTSTQSTAATLIECYSNGAIDVTALDPHAFGLRGINGIGPKRIEALHEAGIYTLEELIDTPLRTLAELPTVGRSAADTIQTAAQARATNAVIPTGEDSLPNQDPVFIDIETDGLNPSTAWLIGVLDGEPQKGTFLSFREQAVGDGSHLKAFITWLDEAAAGRPVVAWNGNQFDFPVITEQLRVHHPELVEIWTERYQFDAYYWATKKNGGNVALPGRSNKLEHVAAALGWEPTTNGIDGATVAKLYTTYRNAVENDHPKEIVEVDWERLETYCEDDVRALATIYEHLETAARQEPATKSPTGENTAQGSLTDFS